MSPEDQAGLVLEFNARLKQWSDLSKEAQESALKEINEKLWWDTEWEKVSKLEELEGFGDDEKISYELRGFREYSSKERVEDFEKRIVDMRERLEVSGYKDEELGGPTTCLREERKDSSSIAWSSETDHFVLMENKYLEAHILKTAK